MIGKSGVWGAATASGGAAICVLALAGWYYARMPRPITPDAPRSTETIVSSSALPRQAAPPAPSLPRSSPAKAPDAGAPPAASPAPRADVVRVLPNGEVVVAGRAEPGARVALLDNGAPLMEMQADAATGEFVFLPPRLPAGAHNLSLRNATKSDAGQMAESAIMAFSIAPDVKAAQASKQAVSVPIAGAVGPPAPGPAAKNNMATIARGDTLWRLSREKFGRGALYPTIVQANPAKIRDPDLIYPGQSLTIP